MFQTEHRLAIAAEVRAELGRKNLPAAKLAERADLAPATLSRKLNGHTGFTVDELFAVAAALDVPAIDLLRTTGKQSSEAVA